jgi:hypothetical protein
MVKVVRSSGFMLWITESAVVTLSASLSVSTNHLERVLSPQDQVTFFTNTFLVTLEPHTGCMGGVTSSNRLLRVLPVAGLLHQCESKTDLSPSERMPGMHVAGFWLLADVQ